VVDDETNLKILPRRAREWGYELVPRTPPGEGRDGTGKRPRPEVEPEAASSSTRSPSGSEGESTRAAVKPERAAAPKVEGIGGATASRGDAAAVLTRIQVGDPRIDKHDKKLSPDDVVLVPDFFGRERNVTVLDDLDAELRGTLGIDGGAVGGDDGTPTLLRRSPALRMVRDRLREYFDLREDSIRVCVAHCDGRKCDGDESTEFRHGPR